MKKIYFASPFFNEEQKEREQRLVKKLKELGYKVFRPSVDTFVPPNSTQVDRLNAFKDNLKAIDECDFVFAVTDGKDVGTIFEAGYAYGIQKPIFYYAETLGENQFNLMLAMSGMMVCTSFDELEDKLCEFLTNVYTQTIYEYMGVIE